MVASYDETGKPLCAMCRRNTPDLSFQSSRSQLLFGGFHVQMEYRCAKCEQQVCQWIKDMLKEVPYEQHHNP